MGGSTSPMGAMLMGMMPLVELKIGEVAPQNMTGLALIMGEAFTKVADETVSIEEFGEWISPLNE